MCNYSKKVKSKLFSLISQMDAAAWLFAKNPGHDFTRKSPLSLGVMLKILISMGGQNIRNELYDFLGFKLTTPSAAAFVKRRGRIDLFAFEFLFHEFSRSFKPSKTLTGYQLLAVDGSDVHTPTNPDEQDSYFQMSENARGYNLYHINALYNLLDKRYTDVQIQPRHKCNEHKALCEMIDRSTTGGKVIVIADRGYESYNNIAHIENKGWKYLIRIKNSSGIINRLSLPTSDEFDIDVDFMLTRSNSKEVKNNPDKYRHIYPDMPFDYLPKNGNGEVYPMHFRMVRVRLSNGVTETLVTNLSRATFPPEALKKLYKMRWGIETSFRELKYNVGLVNFHSKKTDFILQEIYARLIMYNFSMIISMKVCVNQNDKAYVYQINYAEAIHICKHFIRNKESPSNVEALIGKNILPVRPDREYTRKPRMKATISFIYRVA